MKEPGIKTDGKVGEAKSLIILIFFLNIMVLDLSVDLLKMYCRFIRGYLALLGKGSVPYYKFELVEESRVCGKLRILSIVGVLPVF